MVLVAGIAVHVMPCHDCGIYSKHLCIVYHDACETIFLCVHVLQCCICIFVPIWAVA